MGYGFSPHLVKFFVVWTASAVLALHTSVALLVHVAACSHVRMDAVVALCSLQVPRAQSNQTLGGIAAATRHSDKSLAAESQK